MSGQPKQARWRTWLCPPLFSPRGLIHAAVVLALLFTAVHLLGWRSDTAILSGTMPDGASSGGGGGAVLAVAAGALYVVLYFAFVLAVPILLLSAGIMALLLRWTRRRLRISDADSAPAAAEAVDAGAR
jgi:hypothetical protein